MHTVEGIMPRPCVWLHVVVLLANANGLGYLAAALRKCTGDGPGEGPEGLRDASRCPGAQIAEWEPMKGSTFLRSCPFHG